MSARISLLLIFLLVGWGCSPLPRGIYHTVAKGQTLYSVSRAYGVDIKYLARLNGIDDPSRLRVGQRLFIPGADRQQDIPVTIAPHPSSLQDTGGALADVQRPPPAQAGAIRQQPAVKDSVPGPKMVSKDPAVESKANAAESRKGLFIWPARGKWCGPSAGTITRPVMAWRLPSLRGPRSYLPPMARSSTAVTPFVVMAI